MVEERERNVLRHVQPDLPIADRIALDFDR
jgi:hypothetical protein